MFLVFATLDNSVFNRNSFLITDSSLANRDILDQLAAEGKNFESIRLTYKLQPAQVSGRGNNYWTTMTTCYEVTACYAAASARGNILPVPDCPPGSYGATWTECFYSWVWIETGGGGGSGGSGGSSGSGSSGSGSGSGGGTPPECQPTVVRSNSANQNCLPGWEPIPDPPPPPPIPEPIDSLLAKSARAVNRISDSLFNLSLTSGNEWALSLLKK